MVATPPWYSDVIVMMVIRSTIVYLHISSYRTVGHDDAYIEIVYQFINPILLYVRQATLHVV